MSSLYNNILGGGRKKTRGTWVKQTEITKSMGDVVGFKTKLKRVEGVDEYVKMYKGFSFDYSVLSLSECRLILVLRNYVEYGNIIRLDSRLKDDLGLQCGVSRDRINHDIGRLCRNGVLFRDIGMRYIFNPYIYGCGSVVEIDYLKSCIKVVDGVWSYNRVDDVE